MESQPQGDLVPTTSNEEFSATYPPQAQEAGQHVVTSEPQPAAPQPKARGRKPSAKKEPVKRERRADKIVDLPTLMFPISATTRIIKSVTLEHVPLLTEVRLAITRYTFVFFVTVLSFANRHRLSRGGRNIAPHDILYGLNAMGLASFIPEGLHATAIIQQRGSDFRGGTRGRLIKPPGAADDQFGDDMTGDADMDSSSAPATSYGTKRRLPPA